MNFKIQNLPVFCLPAVRPGCTRCIWFQKFYTANVVMSGL